MNQETLAAFSGPIVFTTSWCGPCNILKARLKQENISVIFKVLDENDDTLKFAQEYDVKSVPTLIEFKDGKATDLRVVSGDKIFQHLLLDKNQRTTKVVEDEGQ